MINLVNTNSHYFQYLYPLLKWKIMDLKSLREDCDTPLEYKYFCKLINRLEKQKILESYRSPINRKKYIFLSQIGQHELSPIENPICISRENLTHDLKVTEIVRYLLQQGWIDSFEFDHEILDRRKLGSRKGLIPDAIVRGKKKKHEFSMALELELTQKSITRIGDKISDYFNNSQYDYILYMFSDQRILRKYMEVIQRKFNESYLERMMFFNLNNQDLKMSEGWFKSKETKLFELFSDD